VPNRLRAKDVFINCPFDESYKPIFQAILFAVYDLGFVARCALEIDDASEVRLEKIMRIIEQCPCGVHDLSAVGLSAATKLASSWWYFAKNCSCKSSSTGGALRTSCSGEQCSTAPSAT
jgi:hypothetical protein